jgi:threonine/homoserine/homoserine lactone efflux protein
LKGAPAFIAGFVVGDLIWFYCAALGLTIVAQTYAPLFMAIKYAGAAYLLYLGYRLWTLPAANGGIGEVSREERWVRLFLGSLALTLGNPKVIIFFLAILPTVIDLKSLCLVGFAEAAALITVIISTVLMSYAILADRARRLFASAKSIRRLNRASGGMLALAALAVATKT